MKTLTNYSAIVLLMIAILGASTMNAQEWTKDQETVWQEIENMWTYWKAGDMDAAFANVHADYLGWNNSSPMPMSYTKWVDATKESKDLYSNRNFDIEPARILVHGDAAVVHYYYSMSYTYDDGEEKNKGKDHGRWTEFFVKEGDKWMLLGDFTYEKPEK